MLWRVTKNRGTKQMFPILGDPGHKQGKIGGTEVKKCPT